MGKRSRILLVLCTLILGTTSSSAAFTNHNLHWGIEVGDQFYYRYSGDIKVGNIDFYVEINSLPTIPENVSSFYEIVMSNIDYSFYYSDGTKAAVWLPWGAAPVGNWSLVQELLNDSISYEVQWINTTDEWGGVYTQRNETTVIIATTKYSKTDGVLNLFRVDENPVFGLKTRVQAMRIDDELNPQSPTSIGIGIVVIAAIVVIATVVRKLR